MNFQEMLKKPSVIVGAIVAIVVITGAVVASVSMQESRAQASNDLLFKARKSLETEAKALAVSPAPSATPKTIQSAGGTDASAEFQKLDVDSKFPESLKNFNRVIDSYPSTRAAFEARLALGSLYFNHGDAVHAQQWFQQAADHAPHAADHAFALQSVGYALENQGKLSDAAQTYKKALDYGNNEIKSDLDTAIARCTAGKS
jgi:tetratricopeptide (TPR) repeat protein